MGAESMSTSGRGVSRPFVDEICTSSQEAVDCLQPMGQTSENVGKDFDISREKQDRYAAESYQRAEVAQKSGWFADEITPITVQVDGKEVTLTTDEGPRHGTTFESLSKVRPAFPDYGDRSTGGNSSQVTDGAAAVLLMKRSRALELGQPILAKYVGATVAGLAPRIMGIGPSIAIPKLLGKHGLTLADVDLIELNEAFASMAVYCRDTLHIDWSKMNVRGAYTSPVVADAIMLIRLGRRRHCPRPSSRLHRRPADCDGPERVSQTQGPGPADQHVHRDGHGDGGAVCQRAVVGSAGSCIATVRRKAQPWILLAGQD